jgi:fructose-bisphosphate aldolase class 1
MQPKEVFQIDTFELVYETRRAVLYRATPILPAESAPTYRIESQFRASLSDGTQQMIPIVAPVEAASLTEAFEKAEDVLRAAFDALKAQVAKPRLVVPGQTTTIPNLRGEAARKV